MAVLIRPAEKKDMPEILEINNFEILNSTVNYDYTPKSLEEQTHWFEQKQQAGFPILVAESDGKIHGFATYGTFRSKPGYRFTVEHSVYISNGLRGKGIGKMLMENLIEIARKEGYHTMVGGIDGSNESSYHFHMKLGFKEVARFKETATKFDRWLGLIFVQLML
ncbi:GNAT family N-acetyltransferase [Algoriphagus sp. CAU 1675]|uniref:GNAT family N-acetyltransferase n=1 Tax=Algoriphagus sp. CAU 1675 TaxID=3032597 RepID=UPI0023DAF246|nr:GNAT family N-acetyltransferase [Algoriphagus sp. CAU 1675]MDF2156921.1 GNAT family N-acetyltransferase [Algoriphagus sp. CAU 1675]